VDLQPGCVGSVPACRLRPNATGLTTNTYRAPASVPPAGGYCDCTSIDGGPPRRRSRCCPPCQIGAGAPTDALQYAFSSLRIAAMVSIARCRCRGRQRSRTRFRGLRAGVLRRHKFDLRWALVSASLTLGAPEAMPMRSCSSRRICTLTTVPLAPARRLPAAGRAAFAPASIQRMPAPMVCSTRATPFLRTMRL